MINMFSKCILSLVLLPILLQAVPIPTDVATAPLVHHLATAINRMTANLYSAIRDDNSSNIVVSPFSIHTAASMLYHGTTGITKAELERAIGFRGVNAETIKTENKNLLRSYRRTKLELDTKIEIANSLFADDSFPVDQDYQNLLRNFYFTKVRTVDFADSQQSVDTINSWVKNKTHNLIEELLSPSSVDANTKMVLLNAIYFKANWLVPFNTLDTKKAQFHKSVNDSVQTDFMTVDTELDIGFMDESNTVSVVALPYEDDNYQMLLLVPEQDGDIKELEEKIFDANLKNLSKKLINVRTLLTLPKFKVGYETSLKTAFKKMGAHRVFEANADLSPISNVAGLLVQDILHKAQVEVNEEGSEAAGVTGIFVGIRVSSKPAIININRPFMFVIHDKLNNIPLFIGKIGDPSEVEAKVEPLIAVRDGSQDEFAEFGSQVKEEVSFREAEEDIEKEVEMDAEEEAHIKNFGVTTTEGSSLCGNKKNESDITFPCEGDGDTEPIRDYKKEHGDGSRFGHNGELADLNPQLKQELNKER